jgi:hypothetical protein
MPHVLFATLIAAVFAATTLALPVAPPRTFAAGGMLEFTYPIASPSLANLDVKEERESDNAPTGGVETLHRVVEMRAGGALGPSTVPHPELLAHGPLTTYFQPLDGEMRRHRRRRRAQDAIPENSDALTAPFHGAVCDGKPGLRCTVFEAPIVYGAIGDGTARRTFLYYQNVGSIGPLLDAAQALPEPILSVNTWSRPFGLGWQLPPPAIPLTLRSNLTLSDAWLMVTSETADNAGERADLFLRLLAKLLEKVTPPSRDIADWDDVVQRQSDWTLNTVNTYIYTSSLVRNDRVRGRSLDLIWLLSQAYHNLVPANASTGTWPLSPPDKTFSYIPTYVNDNANCAASGDQGSDHCQAQIFSYLEQLEPGLRYLNDSTARSVRLSAISVGAHATYTSCIPHCWS